MAHRKGWLQHVQLVMAVHLLDRARRTDHSAQLQIHPVVAHEGAGGKAEAASLQRDYQLSYLPPKARHKEKVEVRLEMQQASKHSHLELSLVVDEELMPSCLAEVEEAQAACQAEACLDGTDNQVEEDREGIHLAEGSTEAAEHD